MYEIRELTGPLDLGEGPHWDHNQQALFFVDILKKYIHKYSPVGDKHTKTAFVDEEQNSFSVSFIIPVEGTRDQFVLGVGRKILIFRWDGEDGSEVELVRELGKVEKDRPKNAMNDGKVDPKGRLFTGTMEIPETRGFPAPEKGSIFRVTSEFGHVTVQAVDHKITIPNGLAWDLQQKAFYYVDSHEKKVRRYDYDVLTGNISNKTHIFDLQNHDMDGLPDGITIDTDGNLWIAVFNNGCVIKVDPRTGKLLEKIIMPTQQVTSVTFGGPDYDVLFVTSAVLADQGEAPPPPSGSLFMVTGLGVTGHPNRNFKL